QMPEPEGLNTAREQRFQAEAVKRELDQRLRELHERATFIKGQVKRLREQPGALTDGENSSAECECGQPLAAALEGGCPLAERRSLKGKALPDPAVTIELLEKTLQAESLRLTATQAELEAQNHMVEASRQAVLAETRAFDAQRGKLARESAEFRTLAEEASHAIADRAAARDLEESLIDLDQQIRRSQLFQTAIRERQSATLSTFSGTFSRITRAILGSEIDGSIRFHGRQIRPTLVHGIDLTSAALETLKIICFDLAALISGIEGNSLHPRLLIHDGPREADMDVELYQRLFLLAARLEQSFQNAPPNFQYIVTTTEPPPVSLQGAPWLIEPVLDASHATGKLLGEDF
ncbi:MAG: hypothetical protein V4710_04805, partial [Verrucomicrobiota bacterium]